MNGFTMIITAFNIARLAHKGQKDKAGVAYIIHPVKVAMACKGAIRKTVALLHDTIEDSNITEADLLKEGFPEDVVQAVICLSRNEREDYDEYLARLSLNPIALDVKIQDTSHNLRKSEHYAKTIPGGTDKLKMERRAVKYRRTLSLLLEAKYKAEARKAPQHAAKQGE